MLLPINENIQSNLNAIAAYINYNPKLLISKSLVPKFFNLIKNTLYYSD